LVQRSALSAARRLSMRSVQQSILFIRKKNKCESLDVTSVEASFEVEPRLQAETSS
jgi:hypothetical protein